MQRLTSLPLPYRWIATVFFVVVVVVLSITPGVEQIDDSVFVWLVVNTATPLQKAMHVTIYALLTLLSAWSLEPIKSRVWRIVIAFAAAIALGAVLEWYQTQVPGRFGTVFDALLNIGGAMLGVIVAMLVL